MADQPTSDWTEAERYLLAQIRAGDGDAWSQLIERYQGRLLAFARSRGIKEADAEDLVQDSFLLFLRGLADFRAQSSLETYLFVIVRRQIAEHYRGKQARICRITESLDVQAPESNLISPDPAASWYVRRDEDRQRNQIKLAAALRQLTDRLREQIDFQNLQMLELLFYAQARNKDIANLLGVDQQTIGLQKHRWLGQLRRQMGTVEGSQPDAGPLDALLTEVWESQRPSCPKRSTIGGYVLGSLDAPWQQYVDFHLNQLGCAFCRANLDDLQKQQQVNSAVLRDRIVQSTVGFLRVP